MWYMTLPACPLTLRGLSPIYIYNTTVTHTCMQTHPSVLSCQHQSRKARQNYDKMCWGPLRKLHVRFGPARMHAWGVGVYSISQLSSWPPYARLWAQAGSICRVNAQSQPQAAGPNKPHYSHTHTHSGDTYAVRGRHTWRSQGPSYNEKNHQRLRRCLKIVLAACCQMNVAYMNSLFSMVRQATGQDTN